MKKITMLVIAACIVVIIAIDCWLVLRQGGSTEDSISWNLWQASRTYPAIPFAGGFLCGHLFWSQNP